MGKISLLLCLAFVLAARSAAAEPFGRAEEEAGVRVGVWLFEPVIAAGIRHDDNIFREPAGGQGSLIANVAPSATLRSDWRRHSVALSAGLEAGSVAASPADDWLDGDIAFEGVLDATRATRLRLQVSAAREHEARGGDDAPLSLAEPVRFLRLETVATGQYAPGRLRLQPSIGWERLRFRDTPLAGGGIASQDDRDRDILRAGLFAGWRATRKTEAFIDASVALTGFSDDRDRAGLNRDNASYAALFGVELGKDRILEGRVAAGIARRRYEDRRLKGFTGPVFDAALIWRPTRLVEARAGLSRRLEETTTAPASGVDVTAIEIGGRWSVRRFVGVTALAALENDDFRGADRRDRKLTLGLGAEWSPMRGTTLIFGLRHERERSTAAGENSDAMVLSLVARRVF